MAGGDFVAASRGRGRGRHSRYRPISDINVTPFVDVMLVLLIVFMVTAPLLTVGVPVDLPKTQARTLDQPVEPLVVSIDAGGKIFIQKTEVELQDVVPRLLAITENNPETKIFVRGDETVNYGRVVEVMATVNVAGFTRVALVAKLPGSGDAAAPTEAPAETEGDRSG